MLLVEPAFQVGSGIDAGRRVALEEHQVPAVLFMRSAPEVIEADVVQGGHRGECGHVPAEAGMFLVGPHHHRHGVPADQRADPPLQSGIPRAAFFLRRRNGIEIGRGRAVRDGQPGAPRPVQQALDQVMGARRAFLLEDRIQRLQPLLGLQRVDILLFGARQVHGGGLSDNFGLTHVTNIPKFQLAKIRRILSIMGHKCSKFRHHSRYGYRIS